MSLSATLKLTDDMFDNGVTTQDLTRILQNREVRQWIMRAPYTSIDNETLYNQLPEYHESSGSPDEMVLKLLFDGGELFSIITYLVGKSIVDISKQRALIDLSFDIEETTMGFTDSFSFEVKMHNDESYEPDPSVELARELAFYINEYLDEFENRDFLSDADFLDDIDGL